MDAPCHSMVDPFFSELAAMVARLCEKRTAALVVIHPALLSPGPAVISGGSRFNIKPSRVLSQDSVRVIAEVHPSIGAP